MEVACAELEHQHLDITDMEWNIINVAKMRLSPVHIRASVRRNFCICGVLCAWKRLRCGASTGEFMENGALEMRPNIQVWLILSTGPSQKTKVELAWSNYNTKLLECAQLEEAWVTKVDNCDGQQDAVHEKACEHASHSRTQSSNFGHEYHMTTLAYNEAVTAIRQLEQDRKREWETLHITTCLLETVYTHVIHSIDSGEPCPTTDSHPEETEAAIN